MLKPVKMDTVVTVVSPWDPALDGTKTVQIDESSPDVWRKLLKFAHDEGVVDDDVSELTGRDLYIATAGANPSAWPDLMPVVPGKKPTRFLIGAIPPGELTRIEHDYGSDPGANKMRSWECFRASLRDVEDLGVDGVVPKTNDGGVKRVRPEWIEANFAGERARAAALFVGSVAWMWNNFTGEDAKNS